MNISSLTPPLLTDKYREGYNLHKKHPMTAARSTWIKSKQEPSHTKTLEISHICERVSNSELADAVGYGSIRINIVSKFKRA